MGAPAEGGHFTIEVTVEDSSGATAVREFPMGVYTMELAEKFSPILILTEHPTIESRKVIFPEPVAIMGAESVSNLWFAVFGSAGDIFLDRPYHIIKEKFYDAHGVVVDTSALQRAYNYHNYKRRYPEINFSRNEFASIPEALLAPSLLTTAEVKEVKAHFEYPGDRSGYGPDGWDGYYFSPSHSAAGANFPNTAYVHFFEPLSEGIPGNVAIRYHYFWPYNDFQNLHEGDWQTVSVTVTSHDPDSAKLSAVDYAFHAEGISYTEIAPHRIFDPQIHFAPAEGGTHPVVYVGAGSHGLYPTGGHYERFISEDMTTHGIVLSTGVSDTDSSVAQPYDLIFLPNPDPSQPNMGLSPEMSWLGAGARWGTLKVSSLSSLDTYNESPKGPFQKNSWRSVGGGDYSKLKVPYGHWMTREGIELPRTSSETRWFQQFPIVQDVTWSDTTVVLIGDVVVYPGATLTIEPGTVIKSVPDRDIHGMNDAARVDIVNYGELTADASEGDSIVFRSTKSNPRPGDWYGIRNYGVLTMKNCVIRDSRGSVEGYDRQTSENVRFVNNSPLTVLPISKVVATRKVAIDSIQVSALGGAPPYTYSLSGQPSGISISELTGLITGTPTVEGDSTFTVTVTVRDTGETGSTPTTVQKPFTMSVAYSPLMIPEILDVEVNLDENISIQAFASGGVRPYHYFMSSDDLYSDKVSIDSGKGSHHGHARRGGDLRL